MKQMFSVFMLFVVIAASAEPKDVTVVSGKSITPEDVVEALSRTSHGAGDTFDKGIAARPNQPLPALSIDTITFEFDSSVLTAQAMEQLNVVGQGLASKALAQDTIRIEGHTDSVGSPEYNHNLSLRRAQAVKEYLVRNFGISSERMPIEGKGEDELLDPSQPEAPVNRRVQFVNVQ